MDEKTRYVPKTLRAYAPPSNPLPAVRPQPAPMPQNPRVAPPRPVAEMPPLADSPNQLAPRPDAPVAPELPRPHTEFGMPIPETVTSTLFIPGYLLTQIGRVMRVEFLVGNEIIDKVGRLVEVGASYIILEPVKLYLIVCDLFSIKFVTILETDNLPVYIF